MASVEPTMHRLRPFVGYATVLESDVDEEQRESGLIVPLGGASSHLRRGVVLDVLFDEHGSSGAELIDKGTVIYFHDHADKVGDVLLIPVTCIVAYIEGS